MTPKDRRALSATALGCILILVTSVAAYAQEWTPSFRAGTSDVNGQYMGGSEVLHLVGHRGSLYAAVGYWQDERNILYGGTDPRTGWGQVLRLDSPNGAWEVDLDMGPLHLRPEILREVTLATDGSGDALGEPVTLLLAGAYSPALNTVTASAFTRDDQTGDWARAAIFSGPAPGGENYSMRDVHVHRDRVTGVDRVFVTIGTQGVFSGVYDPGAPGRIRWNPTPEIGPLDVRPLGIVTANGSLLFSAGRRLYQRADGEEPSYAVVHDFGDLDPSVNSAVGGIRGLTTIPYPNGTGDALLLMWSPDGQSQGTIYRLEPDAPGGYTRHLEVRLADLMRDYLNVESIRYLLGAYNEFLAVTNPSTGETEHIVGFQSTSKHVAYPAWKVGYYRGAMYAVRDTSSAYHLEEVAGKVSSEDPALVSTRCYTHSPFDDEHALYFGGHDPNGIVSTDMAWVYRKTLSNTADAVYLPWTSR